MTTNITANPLEFCADELERLALEECVKRQRVDQRVSVLIMPCTRCELAAQFASLGAQVTAAGAPRWQKEIEGRVLASGWRDEIRFAPYALPELPEHPNGELYDIILLRHGLCHLPYDQACQVVRRLLKKLRIGGKLYLSILGLHTELGEGYAAAELPVDARYAELLPVLATKYGIHGPVCLYTERDLFLLLLAAGASVLRTLTTTYGNVKGVAMRV